MGEELPSIMRMETTIQDLRFALRGGTTVCAGPASSARMAFRQPHGSLNI